MEPLESGEKFPTNLGDSRNVHGGGESAILEVSRLSKGLADSGLRTYRSRTGTC